MFFDTELYYNDVIDFLIAVYKNNSPIIIYFINWYFFHINCFNKWKYL